MPTITSNLVDPGFPSGGIRSIDFTNAFNLARAPLDSVLAAGMNLTSSTDTEATFSFPGGSAQATGSFADAPDSFVINSLISFAPQTFSVTGNLQFTDGVLGTHFITGLHILTPAFALDVS